MDFRALNDPSVAAGAVSGTRHAVVTEVDLSVIVCAYTERRWNDLELVIRSLEQQTLAPREVVLVIDHHPGLLERARAAFPHIICLENPSEPGLSGARNAGLEVARGSVIAFLDDDTTAAVDWVEKIWSIFEDPNVIGVGGSIKPQSPTPSWLPEEFMWVVGCAYRGLPVRTAQVRNLFGGNMAYRRYAFEQERFRTELGRVGNVLLAGEETDLCLRLANRFPGTTLVYEPPALVFHAMPPERTSWRYFRARCFGEGVSKAMLRRFIGNQRGLSTEWRYTLHVLPSGILHNLIAAARGDRNGLARAGAIIVGFSLTVVGYGYGSWRAWGVG